MCEYNKDEANANSHLDLDDVLLEELGQFGRFELKVILLASVPVIMAAFMSEFIFATAAIPHRCRIPECGENGKLHDFKPEWFLNAVPKTSDGLSSCERYVPQGLGANGTLNYCPANIFNQFETIKCDGYVYERDNTIVYEFDLGCEEDLRALAAISSGVGTLLFVPITGYISDRFGRKLALTISAFNLALFGFIRAFSVNYTMYIILQIAQIILGAGTFSSAFILGAEFIHPKYRVITTATISSMLLVGQGLLGGIAWLIQSWRYIIMVIYIPCFLVISYYWILPESVRWLLSKRKFTEAKEVLENVARVNKTYISEKSLEALISKSQLSAQCIDIKKPGLVRSIIRSPIILQRVCITALLWMISTFVYFGPSINLSNRTDTMQLNLILTCATEIPGGLTSFLALDRIGRKATICCGLFFSAFCNLVLVFISKELYALHLLVFLLAKLGISTVMTSLNLYTSELFPTEFRHSLFAFCSMIGSIGSITAPLTQSLTNYWHGIPSMLFCIMGILGGLLVFTQPETMDIKLPDTLTEAEALGKNDSRLKESR